MLCKSIHTILCDDAHVCKKTLLEYAWAAIQ